MTDNRQRFQDSIIRNYLDAAVVKDANGEICTTPTQPWIVFTAGAMGSGKGYTVKKLVEKGRFPLMAFVRVDPDAIRRFLPEFKLYVELNPELAGDLTNKEAGFIAEILTLAGLEAGKNVMVDGSLRHLEWYKKYFAKLRADYRNLRLAIIHVTAPRDAIFARAESRAKHTGRVVPRKLLEQAIEEVPRSVAELAPLVDYHIDFLNAPGALDVEITTPGETWDTFHPNWIQVCKWVSKSRQRLKKRSEKISKDIVRTET